MWQNTEAAFYVQSKRGLLMAVIAIVLLMFPSAECEIASTFDALQRGLVISVLQPKTGTAQASCGHI